MEKKTRIYFWLFFISFFIATVNSALIERSSLVLIYLIFFIFLSFNLVECFKKNTKAFDNTLLFFVVSIYANIIIIFFYDFTKINWETFQEVRRFKGVLNIICVLVLLLPFFKKSKFNLIPFLILPPCLIISNCNSAILGVLIALLSCFIYYLYQNLSKKKVLVFTSLFTLIFSSFIISNLPNKFDYESIQNYNFKIPTQLIDAHRQYIWGFSLEKFKEKPFFGYGPDTSNFIPDGQKEIGSPDKCKRCGTGTMKFIPSHPHNFLVELLLETGLFGTIFFLAFICLINLKIAINSDNYDRFFLLFFNFYFWGASLVNFSFWLGWWQGSYFLILALIFTKILSKKNN